MYKIIIKMVRTRLKVQNFSYIDKNLKTILIQKQLKYHKKCLQGSS